MRFLTVGTFVCSLAWFAACEPAAFPVSGIPNPAGPTTQADPARGAPSERAAFRRTINGTVRAVDGGTLAGVEIEAWSDSAGVGEKVAETAADGTFRIETAAEAFEFHKKGYQSRWWLVPYQLRDQPTHTLAVKLQTSVLVAAGTRSSSVITPDDLTYPDGGNFPWDMNVVCEPCKLVEVSGADTGATLKLAWSGSTPLSLWAGSSGWGHDVEASARPGESEIVVSSEFAVTVILVGVNSSTVAYPLVREPVPFTLSVER